MSVLKALRALDEKTYNLERWIVFAIASVMTLVVFSAVFWRVFADRDGGIEGFLVRALGSSHVAQFAIRVMVFLVFAGLCCFASKSAEPKIPARRAAGIGLIVAGSVYLAGYTLVWLLPHGVVFSQKLSLALLLWLVCLGSSMAAHKRRHIAVQAALKLIPDHLKHLHAALSLLLAGLFTGFLWWVCTRYTIGMFQKWVDSDFRAARVDSIPIPFWTVTTAMSVGLGITVVRFVFQAILVGRKEIPAAPPHDEDPALSLIASDHEP